MSGEENELKMRRYLYAGVGLASGRALSLYRRRQVNRNVVLGKRLGERTLQKLSQLVYVYQQRHKLMASA